MLLYEAGEGLRFDEFSIRVGVKGVLRVLKHLGMVAGRGIKVGDHDTPVAKSSAWMRAPEGGILRSFRDIGDTVRKGDTIGMISDPFGENETEIKTTASGLIIGRTNLPVVNRGDALFHIAQLPRSAAVGDVIDALGEEMTGDPLFDEDEII
jgi:predicted deacylase